MNSFGRFLMVVWVSSLVAVRGAGLVEETVEVTGRGNTLEAAIKNALVEAIQQVNGIEIESRNLRKQLEFVRAAGNDLRSLTTDEYQSAISTAAKGFIKRYEVISQSGISTDLTEVAVRAVVNRYVAGVGSSRKRIAVLPFRTGEGPYRVGEHPVAGTSLERQWRSLLIEHLVQSRRFSVLDREFSLETQMERDRLKKPQSRPEERVRLGQELGADYIVVGSFEEFRLTAENGVFRASGRQYQRLSLSIRLSYRIIELATGQTVLGDNLRVPPGPPFAAGAATDSATESYLMHWMAQRVATRVTWTLYPVKVVAFTMDGEAVLNQGGAALQVGDFLEAFNLGQRLIDPYTKEFIGNEELLAGILEITRVLPKTTYARVISTNRIIAAGAICRPATVLESSSQTETESTLEKTKSDTDALFK